MCVEPTSNRILLIGISGLYNYGCEAIVRGTHALLRQQWSNARIFYATPRLEEDAQRLADLDLEVIPRKLISRYSIPSLANKLLRLAGVSTYIRRDSLRTAKTMDAVLSIGGDLYTIYASGHYPGSLIKFGDAVLASGKPYVLWGSSIGPFTARPDVESLVKAHLERTTLITVRDVSTLEYLESLGIRDNVIPCADPAFAVAPDIESPVEGPHETRIAINLSPLSARYLRLSRSQAIEQSARAIQRIVSRLDCSILLVPHVVIPTNPSDDDSGFLAAIQDAVPAPIREQVQLIEGDIGFIETKRELSRCSLAVAARMHCAISAMSAAVPTLLLAYSEKAVGMSKYVYETDQYVFPLTDLGSDRCLAALGDMLAQRKTLSEFLHERNEQIKLDAERAAQGLVDKLSAQR